jgi:alanine dehydrogenase
VWDPAGASGHEEEKAMRVGMVKEIKRGEVRVAMTPAVVGRLVAAGHEVLVESGAGDGARFDDQRYESVGGRIVPEAADVWRDANLLVKVKEPQADEFEHFHAGLTLFGYLHVAGNRELITGLIDRQVTAIAFEAVADDQDRRPILEPMLAIAGTMGMLLAFTHATSTGAGRGKLPGGVAGIAPTAVRILGTNPMAYHAARTAAALGAEVALLDPDPERLRLAVHHVPGIRTLVAHPAEIARAAREADILVNTFPWPKDKAGHLVTAEVVRTMKPRALVVDLASDDPGAVETSRPTTFDEPIHLTEGIPHFCVPNVPSSVARSSTTALANALIPFLDRICELGVRDALRVDPRLRRGLMAIEGHIVDDVAADWYGVTAVRAEMVLGLER